MLHTFNPKHFQMRFLRYRPIVQKLEYFYYRLTIYKSRLFRIIVQTSKSTNTDPRSAAIFEIFPSNLSFFTSSDGRVTVSKLRGQRFHSQVSQKFFNLFKWGIEPKGEQEQEQQEQQEQLK